MNTDQIIESAAQVAADAQPIVEKSKDVAVEVANVVMKHDQFLGKAGLTLGAAALVGIGIPAGAAYLSKRRKAQRLAKIRDMYTEGKIDAEQLMIFVILDVVSKSDYTAITGIEML